MNQQNSPATIAQVAESSEASKAVFQAFKERQRRRSTTDLNRLFNVVLENNKKVSREEFLTVFKSLETIGAGRLIIGRKNNPDRFKWRYNLKEVAQAEGSLSDLNPLPAPKPKVQRRRRVNKKGIAIHAKTKKTIETLEEETQVPKPKNMLVTTPVIQFSLTLPATTTPADVQALIDLVKGLK